MGTNVLVLKSFPLLQAWNLGTLQKISAELLRFVVTQKIAALSEEAHHRALMVAPPFMQKTKKYREYNLQW